MFSNLLIAALVFLISGCSKPESTPSSIAQVDSHNGSPNWSVETKKSPDGTVSLTAETMPPTQADRLKAEYRRTDLVPVPVDSKFNANLFRINNVPEYENAVFIAPRLFAYGADNDARLAIERNSDGTVTIPFPVILVDGSTESIQGPSSERTVPLPDAFRLQHETELRRQLETRLGFAPNLAPLPGCPRRIVVTVNGRTFDATPTDLSSADYCATQAPFNVSLRVPEAEARYLLEEALYANAVDVRAIFETRVSFATARLKLEFDKAKIFSDLQAELGARFGVFEADAHAALQNVIRRQAFRLQFQGDLEGPLAEVVRQAVDLFFEPFQEDPSARNVSCKSRGLCLKLNYSYSRNEETLSVEWTQTTNAMTGQTFVTWTKLKPLHDKVVRIGGSSRPLLINDESPLETGLTVLPGDLLEVTPAYLLSEERELEVPRVERTSRLACLASEPIFEERCWTSRVHCHRGECFGGERTCERVLAGERCLRSEDQWLETTRYVMSSPRYETRAQPIGDARLLFDGLKLQFAWNDGSVTCPLDRFDRSGDGRSLLVRLENRPGCEIFSPDARQKPMLYLINAIRQSRRIRTGLVTRFWDGRLQDETTWETFVPRIGFAGTVAIRGYSFESAFPAPVFAVR